MKKQNGITLIALVITIIILLILAMVSIRLVMNSGIISRAEKGVDSYSEAQEEEQVKLAAMDAKMANNGGVITKENLKTALDNQFGEGNYTLTGETAPFNVTITNGTGREYTIDDNGTITSQAMRKWKKTDDGAITDGKVELKIGDYINYEYDIISTGYELSKDYSGNKDDQTIEQSSNILGWRVLNIDEKTGQLELISDTPTSNSISFGGALGYNNGVYLLNDICEKLYSNKNLKIKARSLNLMDIEKHMNEKGIDARNSYEKYKNVATYTGSKYYPNLYAKESGSGIDTSDIKNNGVDSSNPFYDQPTTETYSQSKNMLNVTDTYYKLNGDYQDFFNNNTYEIIFSGNLTWIASRSVCNLGNYSVFELVRVQGAGSPIAGGDLFATSTDSWSYYFSKSIENIVSSSFRPVVTLNSNVQIDTSDSSKDGTSADKAYELKEQ